MHPDIQQAKALLYDACHVSATDFFEEQESTEYAAWKFMLDGKPVIHRSAKITPTKTGQFVTIWKRIPGGTIVPFDESDVFTHIIISARKEQQFGQFIFPRKLLLQKNIISGNKQGKRGIRVYAPWDEPTSPQAIKTQQWQLPCFIDLSEKGNINTERAENLLIHP